MSGGYAVPRCGLDPCRCGRGCTEPKPPHARVKWKYRETADSEYATHYDGSWTVCVQDCDGDRSVWSIHHKDSNRELAEGEVCAAHTQRDDFDIAMDTALACLAAMKAERHEQDH